MMGQFFSKPSNDKEPLLKLPDQYVEYTENFLPVLINILESLSKDEFKKFLLLISDMTGCYQIPEGRLDGRDRAEVATLMNKAWPERLCLINTRDLLKMIPRNDLEKKLRPHLETIGEKW